jgi:hypothetical protein
MSSAVFLQGSLEEDGAAAPIERRGCAMDLWEWRAVLQVAGELSPAIDLMIRRIIKRCEASLGIISGILDAR